MTLLRLDGRQFGITNNHVIERIEEIIELSGSAHCYVGMASIDPLRGVVDRSRDLDIAVFDLEGVDPEIINGGAFQSEIAYLEPIAWPPSKVARDELLTICGYPKATREHQGADRFLFRSVSGSAVRVETLSDEQIGCRFELDLSTVESDRPDEPFPNELGGMSGGLVMAQRPWPGGVRLEAVAIVKEYHGNWDMCYLAPLDAVQLDGSIRAGAGEMLRETLRRQRT